jgi:hypothetical protein
MKQSEKKIGLSFTSSAEYRIRVKGFLDGSWTDRFCGMSITNDTDENQVPVVTLVGTAKDQCELLGVLNSLYEMHLPLLFLELLAYDEGESNRT